VFPIITTGAGITLVSEVLHQSVRGYGTMLVASVGVSGAILVATAFDWRKAFLIGSVLGLVLLINRIKVADSGMFRVMEEKEGVSRGNFPRAIRDTPNITPLHHNQYVWQIVKG
jgi:hypothetical protein